MKKLALSVAVLAIVGGCGTPVPTTNTGNGTTTTTPTTPLSPVFQTLAQIGNTALADAQQAVQVAQAATPPDNDGANCWSNGVVPAIQDIAKVNAAANNSNSGVFTAVEMASLFQPQSAQYNYVVNMVGTACIAKANDVLGAANVVAMGGVMAVLPQVIGLAGTADARQAHVSDAI